MRRAACFFLSLLLLSRESCAVKLSIQPPPASQGPKITAGGKDPLTNKGNELYTTNITISEQVVTVALDMATTDLWVMPPDGLPSFNDTHLNATVYNIISPLNGFGTVTGEIGVGVFELSSGYSIPFQAFLNVQPSSSDDGIFGVWGLGLEPSFTNTAVQQAYGSNATWGQSVLANIFAENSTGDDYIGISLSRSGDTGGTADAFLTISEYDSDYQAVANSPKVPRFSTNSFGWTVLLDALSVGGNKIDWPSISEEAPAGKNIVQIDIGTDNVRMPLVQLNALYSTIPGSVSTPYVPNLWIIPCNASVNVVATFGGQDFPIHPLDLTAIQVITSPDGRRNYTMCTASWTEFVFGKDEGVGDALFGSSFLRNAFTVFNFGTGGNTTGNPFLQMLPQTNSTTAAADAIAVRTALMANMPPELAPVELQGIINGTIPSGNTGSPAQNSTALAVAPSLSLVGAISVAVISFL
ncbi:aspartic peptidase domain-containing protein [Mycena maculata]|uniref:Aspartic peptidase domain-containing protein n=1 Tax=Mycena maculata TaxID=230809 RepID=A0AAD7I0C2_9AGAR|nr:aspartic peptidase domain-containing protein [Mycena maculata]